MRFTLLIAAALLVAPALGCSSPTSTASQGSNFAPTVTMAKYEQVKDGMTYEEVEAIMGSKGEEISRSKSGEFELVMYTWKNATGSMIAMFQNGKLKTKSQYGLK